MKLVRIRKCDSIWTNMFDEAIRSLKRCNDVLDASSGPIRVRFFKHAVEEIQRIKGSFIKRIEPYIVKTSLHDIDASLWKACACE